MKRPKTLPAFSKEQYIKAHALLASRVATMMGRTLEEADWSDVYHVAKGIPITGWSNLDIDVNYEGLGLEIKTLCVQSKKTIKEHCGSTQMHPALTRKIRIPSTEDDATKVAQEVLQQYADNVHEYEERVAETSPDGKADMRFGWLLWQESLVEFLYFEEEMLAPDPKDYRATWKESGGGARKRSKTLWVYENETGKKRYSITTEAGAKIQPYFDVPPPDDPNLYYFRVQGEEFTNGFIRIWVTPTTALLLKQKLGDLDPKKVSSAILEAAQKFALEKETNPLVEKEPLELAEPVLVTLDAYKALTEAFEGVSDEHMVQLFVRYLYKTT